MPSMEIILIMGVALIFLLGIVVFGGDVMQDRQTLAGDAKSAQDQLIQRANGGQ